MEKSPEFMAGVLSGLRAAALLCQELSGEKDSRYSEKIMHMHTTLALQHSQPSKAKGDKNASR